MLRGEKRKVWLQPLNKADQENLHFVDKVTFDLSEGIVPGVNAHDQF